MKINCECGCGGIIEYAPGNELYLPGHHPNPIEKIKTETISLKTALENKGMCLNKPACSQKTLTRAVKTTIRNNTHRCFLCGRFEIGYKKAFSVCVIDAHGKDIAVLLCNKCKSNKGRLFNPIINKFNALDEDTICEIDSVLTYNPREGRKEESNTNL